MGQMVPVRMTGLSTEELPDIFTRKPRLFVFPKHIINSCTPSRWDRRSILIKWTFFLSKVEFYARNVASSAVGIFGKNGVHL